LTIPNSTVLEGVGLVVPTYNAGERWKSWLNAYMGQVAKPEKALIVDSSSTDNTVKWAREVGLKVIVIEKSTFNHGGTRQVTLQLLEGVKCVIFLTQDAILASDDSLLKLVNPIEDQSIGAVFGRQIPHLDATPIAAHARYFNYPSESCLKGMSDIPNMGLKAAFCSNSMAAYNMSILRECGGFPDDVIFGEDIYVVSKMILAGYKNFYCADATVYHSHNYSLVQEFQRYFDIGVFHQREPWMLKQFGGVSGEGLRYVRSEIKYLGLKKGHYLPSAAIRTVLKLVGYRLGLLHRRLGVYLCKKFSMNEKYWDHWAV
jgi:rhamnosyltransferase